MQTQASRTWANVLCSPNGHGLSALCKAPCEAVRSALAKTSHGKARRVRAHVHSYAPRRGASAPPAPRTAQDGDVRFRVPAPGGALTGNPRIWTSPLPGTVCGSAHSHGPTFLHSDASGLSPGRTSLKGSGSESIDSCCPARPDKVITWQGFNMVQDPQSHPARHRVFSARERTALGRDS
uniref:Uncharacterized protein n=1 Tax=Rousettus aegyptiacus TaxID=9407 RepID=A0A7J8BEC7_ROUAE|nr:hypothetical protein HJG63_009735 [Rousettus aegyptiacus]